MFSDARDTAHYQYIENLWLQNVLLELITVNHYYCFCSMTACFHISPKIRNVKVNTDSCILIAVCLHYFSEKLLPKSIMFVLTDRLKGRTVYSICWSCIFFVSGNIIFFKFGSLSLLEQYFQFSTVHLFVEQ